MKRAAWREHLAQRAQSVAWARQVVKHAGADDLLERAFQIAGALHCKMSHFEVLERICAFQIERMRDAGFADIDAYNAGVRPSDGIMRGLIRAAAGDEDTAVIAIGLIRPEQICVGSPAFVGPCTTIRIDIVSRRRVWMVVVKLSDPRRSRGAGCRVVSAFQALIYALSTRAASLLVRVRSPS